MARGFSVVALLVALLAVGYDRFFEVASTDDVTAPADDREVYQSWEGGDGPPPTPAP